MPILRIHSILLQNNIGKNGRWLVRTMKTAGTDQEIKANCAHLSSGRLINQENPLEMVPLATHGMSLLAQKEANLHLLPLKMRTMTILNSATTPKCSVLIIEDKVMKEE